MTPERLSEIKNRITRNHSAPDLPELAFELIKALEPRLEAERALEKPPHAPPTPNDPAQELTPTPEIGGEKPDDEESGGFFSRKKSKK